MMNRTLFETVNRVKRSAEISECGKPTETTWLRYGKSSWTCGCEGNRNMITYPFTEEESRVAFEEWGANCGPNALAFALQIPLGKVRPVLNGFAERRYTNPTMMREALAAIGQAIEVIRGPFRGANLQRGIEAMFAGPMSLVRVQWTGPWTADGASFKWAARQTHWIATWGDGGCRVFDCNGGIQTFEDWDLEIVPAITATIPRADGCWFPANIWRLREATKAISTPGE